MLVVISQLFVFVQILAVPGSNGFDWIRLALMSLFVQWIVLSSSSVLHLARPKLERLPIWKSVVMTLLGIQAITLTLTLLSQFLVYPDYLFPDWQQVCRNLLAALIIATMLLRYFYIQHEVHIQQKVIYNARLDSLQARIRPHFLFNSMNIITSLIQINPKRAEQAICDLSDLFRSSLQNKNSVVPLTQEIQLSKSYLRIEQQRLGSRLQLNWQIDDLSDRISVPPFTIQPLVENAVYHGIQPLETGGCITINIEIDNCWVQISVENPMPIKVTSSNGNRMALSNIKSRLTMIYGKDAKLTTHIRKHAENQTKIFTARVVYPYE